MVPVTVAVNCWVPFDGTDTAEGEMVTAITGAVTVMLADPDLVESSVDVAVTVTDPVVLGAVKTPALVILPALALQETLEL